MIILTTSCIGFYYSKMDYYRLQELLNLKKALVMLSSEIEYAANPLPIAMEEIAARIDGVIQKMLLNFSKKLKKCRNTAIEEMWSEVVRSYVNGSYFNGKDRVEIESFGKTLGYLDKVMQLRNIQLTLQYVDEQIEYIYSHQHAKAKLYRNIGILSGIMITIVLL